MKKQTTAALKKKAWKVLSEWIRRSHADEGGTNSCYTCGRLMFWKESQAGHAIGGRHGAVLLDVSLLRPQCVGCNVFQRGNYPVFTTKLIKEMGMDWWESKLKGSRESRKWTRPELEDFIREYSQRLTTL